MSNFFLTFLSCADLRWEELPYIINKLNNLSDEKLKNVSYQEWCNLLNSTSILVLRVFNIRFKYFSKKSYLMIHRRKTKYYAIRIEFQERGNAHTHSFIQIFTLQILKMKLPTLSSLRKQLMLYYQIIRMIQSFLSQLRLSKFMSTLEFSGNTIRINVAFRMVDILMRRKLLQVGDYFRKFLRNPI